MVKATATDRDNVIHLHTGVGFSTCCANFCQSNRAHVGGGYLASIPHFSSTIYRPSARDSLGSFWIGRALLLCVLFAPSLLINAVPLWVFRSPAFCSSARGKFLCNIHPLNITHLRTA